MIVKFECTRKDGVQKIWDSVANDNADLQRKLNTAKLFASTKLYKSIKVYVDDKLAYTS